MESVLSHNKRNLRIWNSFKVTQTRKGLHMMLQRSSSQYITLKAQNSREISNPENSVKAY